MTHSKSILELKRKALAMGLCGDYKEKWGNSTTHRDIIHLATDVNGADFLCASAEKGWGLSKDFILQNFPEYINGKYIARQGKDKGYTSEIFIGYSGKITARTTILIVLYSDATVQVPKNHVCKIFAARNPNINIQCEGYCELINYTPEYDVKKEGSGQVAIADPKEDNTSWMNFNTK